MSDRRENSVLVALKELRGIEDDRVKREQEAMRARIEAERMAKEAAERQAKEEDDSRRAAEEERLRRAEEEKQAKIREEQLRVEEAERRARVDGEMKLQEQRMRLEIQSRAAHAGKSPVKAIAGVAVVLALLGGVVVYKIQAANKREIAENARLADEARRVALAAQAAELEKKLAAITRDMDEKLKSARTETERAQIMAEARAKKEAAAEDRADRPARTARRRGGGSNAADQPAKAPTVHVPGKRDINDNILDGL